MTSDEYLKWMNLNLPTFTDNTRHHLNNGARLCMFTIVSQHVYGDSIEECIDNGIIRAAQDVFWNQHKIPLNATSNNTT